MSNAKIANIKSWIKDHTEEIAIGSVITVGVAAFAAACYITIKENDAVVEDAKARLEKYTEFVNDALSSGAQIYHLADESFLTVDREGNQKITFV